MDIFRNILMEKEEKIKKLTKSCNKLVKATMQRKNKNNLV